MEWSGTEQNGMDQRFHSIVWICCEMFPSIVWKVDGMEQVIIF